MATRPVVMETVANLEKLKKPAELEFRPSQVEIGKPGVWCVKKIKEGELFGPYIGEKVLHDKDGIINYRYAWEVFDPAKNEIIHIINATNPHHGNWMRYVNCARYYEEQNIVSVQLDKEIFYKSIKDIEVGEELLTWFDLYDRNSQGNKKTDKKKKQNENKAKTFKKSGEVSQGESPQSPRRKTQPCITASLLQKKSSPQTVPDVINTPEKTPDKKSPTRCKETGKKSSPQKYEGTITPQKTPGKIGRTSCVKPNQTPKDKEVTMVTPNKRRFIDDKESPKPSGGKKKKREIQTTVSFKISKRSSSSGNITEKTSTKVNSSPRKDTKKQLKSDKNPKYDPQFFHFYTEKEHQVIEDGRRLYSCNLCDTIYQKPFSLKRHFLRTHINCRYLAPKDLINCCINVTQQENKIRKAQQLQNSGFKLLNRLQRSPHSSPTTGATDKAAPVKSCMNGVREITSVKNEFFPGLYKCDVCYFIFDEMTELSVHINTLHKNEGKYSLIPVQTKNKKPNIPATNKQETKNSKMVGSMLSKIFLKDSPQKGENVRENTSDDVDGRKHQTKSSTPLKISKKSKNEEEEIPNGESPQDGVKGKKNFSKSSGATPERTSLKTKNFRGKTTSQNNVKREVMLTNNSSKSGKSPTYSNSATKAVKQSPASGGKVVTTSPSKSRKDSKSPSTPVKNITKTIKMSPRTSPRLAGSPGTKGKQSMKPKGKPRGNKYIKQRYKNHPCTQCKVRFTKLENLNKHLKDHQENKWFPCYFCGKNFMNETKMKQHVRYHFGQNVSCRHCPQRFPNVGDMRHHLMTEHEEEWLIKQSEEEEERKQAQKTKKSQRRRTKRVRVISEEDYRKVLTENKMIQPKIKESLCQASPQQSMKILSSPISRRKSQEDSENEAAANGYKSKYRYSCFTCKKRFISYHSLVQHRKTSHRYDRYNAPSTLLHMKQKVSEEMNPIGALPMLSAPVSPDPYYTTIEDNVKTNLASFLDGHEDSLKNFKRHIQIHGYKSMNSVSPIKTETVDWTNFNFPFHYEPYESVIGYNKPNQGPITPEAGSPTLDLAKPMEDTDDGGYLRSGNKRKCELLEELKLDIANDDPPILTRMSEETSKLQLPRRQSGESERSMPSLTPSLKDNSGEKFFFSFDSTDTSKLDSQKEEIEQDEISVRFSCEESLSGCHGDQKDVNDGPGSSCETENKSDLSVPGNTDMSNGALNSLKHLVPQNQQPPTLELVTKEVDDVTSNVPTLDALNLIKVSNRQEVIRKIQAANENIPAHVFEKDIRETLSAQKWDGFNESIAFGKLGAVTNVCSACYRYFDTIEHLFRHQWTKHSSMQYRHLQMEQGHGIDSLFYSWPCNEGLVAASTPVPEDCHSLPVYRCTRCKSSFKNISRLHVHIISCDPRKLFFVQRISFKEKRKLEEKERRRQEKLKVKEEKSKVKEEKGKKRKLNRLSQAKAQIQMKRNSEKVKKMIKARQEAKSPKKSNSINLPQAGSQKHFPRNLREIKQGDLDISSDNNARVTRQRKRRNYELLYKPDNHIRRRETADVVETHQCSGCSSKFRTLFLLERHARKCSEKEKLRSLNPIKEAKPSNKSNQQHNCQYCSRKFTYLKSLSNHYADFCAIRKEKEKNGELKQEEVDLEKLLKEELKALDGNKKESAKVDQQGNLAEEEMGKKRCGWPRGLKRKHRRKNHCWTYTKKKKTSSQDSSRMNGGDEEDGILDIEDEDDTKDIKKVGNNLTDDRDGLVNVKKEEHSDDDDDDDDDYDGDAKNKQDKLYSENLIHEANLSNCNKNVSRDTHNDDVDVDHANDDVDDANDVDDVNDATDEKFDNDEDVRDDKSLSITQENGDLMLVPDVNEKKSADTHVGDENKIAAIINLKEDVSGKDRAGEITHENKCPDIGGRNGVNNIQENVNGDAAVLGGKLNKNKEEIGSIQNGLVENKILNGFDKLEENKINDHDLKDINDHDLREIKTDALWENKTKDLDLGDNQSNDLGRNGMDGVEDDFTKDVVPVAFPKNEGLCGHVAAVPVQSSSSAKGEAEENDHVNDNGNRINDNCDSYKHLSADLSDSNGCHGNMKNNDFDEEELTNESNIIFETPTIYVKKPVSDDDTEQKDCDSPLQRAEHLSSLKTVVDLSNVHIIQDQTDGGLVDLPHEENSSIIEIPEKPLTISSEPTDNEESEVSTKGVAPIVNHSTNVVDFEGKVGRCCINTIDGKQEAASIAESTHEVDSETSRKRVAPSIDESPINEHESTRVVQNEGGSISIYAPCEKSRSKGLMSSNSLLTLSIPSHKTSPEPRNTSSKTATSIDYQKSSSAVEIFEMPRLSPCVDDHKAPLQPVANSIKSEIPFLEEQTCSNVVDKNIACDQKFPDDLCCVTLLNDSDCDIKPSPEDVKYSPTSVDIVDNNNQALIYSKEITTEIAGCNAPQFLESKNNSTTGDVGNSSDETDNETGLYNQDTETDTDVNYNAETEPENDVEISVKNVKPAVEESEDLHLFTSDYFSFTKVPDFHFINKESNSKVTDSHEDVDRPTSGKESDGNGCLTTIVDVAPDSDVSR